MGLFSRKATSTHARGPASPAPGPASAPTLSSAISSTRPPAKVSTNRLPALESIGSSGYLAPASSSFGVAPRALHCANMEPESPSRRAIIKRMAPQLLSDKSSIGIAPQLASQKRSKGLIPQLASQKSNKGLIPPLASRNMSFQPGSSKSSGDLSGVMTKRPAPQRANSTGFALPPSSEPESPSRRPKLAPHSAKSTGFASALMDLQGSESGSDLQSGELTPTKRSARTKADYFLQERQGDGMISMQI